MVSEGLPSRDECEGSLDPKQVEALTELREVVPPEAFTQLIEMILVDVPTKLHELKRLWHADDMDGFSRTAHALKGNLSTLAVEPMMDLCVRLEHLADQRSIDGAGGVDADVQSVLADLRRRFDTLRPLLQREIG